MKVKVEVDSLCAAIALAALETRFAVRAKSIPHAAGTTLSPYSLHFTPYVYRKLELAGLYELTPSPHKINNQIARERVCLFWDLSRKNQPFQFLELKKSRL